MNLHDYGFYGPIKWLSSVQVNSKILPLILIIQIQRLPLNVLGLVKETLHNASWAFAVDGTDRNASSAVILPIHFTAIFLFFSPFQNATLWPHSPTVALVAESVKRAETLLTALDDTQDALSDLAV